MDGVTRKTEFNGATGEKLAAALELPHGTPRAYALFAHCFSCSKDLKSAREIARQLRAEGFAVLRFDFTGLGLSEGDFGNTNFSSNVEDLLQAADFLRREFEAPALLIGHSFGGAAAIVAAIDIPEVKAVAVIGAPSDATHVLRHFGDKRREIESTGAAEVEIGGRPFTIRRKFIEDLAADRVTEAAARLKRALLVMHAPLDDTVSAENATRLFLAARHPKSFVSLDQADHLLSDAGDARYAARVIAAWASRYLPPASAAPKPSAQGSPEYPAPFTDGASAQTIPGRALAVALSVDGHSMTIDASPAEGGDGLGPNPTRTVEGALAACGVMTMAMYARRKGWTLHSSRIDVRRMPSEDAHAPRRLGKSIFLEGDLDDVQRARLVEIADKCPVHKMLTENLIIERLNP